MAKKGVSMVASTKAIQNSLPKLTISAFPVKAIGMKKDQFFRLEDTSLS